MTDVIFLLLIFFMVTSTFVFPTALEVNLPQSSEQTAIKPGTRVYIDKEHRLYASFGDEEPQAIEPEALLAFLQLAQKSEVLDMGARNNLKMVLATKPTQTTPSAATNPQPLQ